MSDLDEDEKSEGGEEGAPAWMATFADLATLLLTFFVLLLSFASMDVAKFKDAMGSIQQALGFLPAGTGVFQHTDTPPLTPAPPVAQSAKKEETYSKISDELKKMMEELKLQDNAEVTSTGRGVLLRVKGHIFFMQGAADVKEASYPVLKKIAEVLKSYSSKVAIEGHTDNVPMAGKFSNNWELSTARAYNTLRYLSEKEGVDPSRLHIAGFADTHPIASNDTAEGQTKNRRVEFVFYEK